MLSRWALNLLEYVGLYTPPQEIEIVTVSIVEVAYESQTNYTNRLKYRMHFTPQGAVNQNWWEREIEHIPGGKYNIVRVNWTDGLRVRSLNLNCSNAEKLHDQLKYRSRIHVGRIFKFPIIPEIGYNGLNECPQAVMVLVAGIVIPIAIIVLALKR